MQSDKAVSRLNLPPPVPRVTDMGCIVPPPSHLCPSRHSCSVGREQSGSCSHTARETLGEHRGPGSVFSDPLGLGRPPAWGQGGVRVRVPTLLCPVGEACLEGSPSPSGVWAGHAGQPRG